MRRPKRKCTTPKCKGAPTLYPQCDACRKGACQHTNTHYDSVFAKVCDDCGTTVQAPTKRKGKYKVGMGKKAPWQACPDGLKVPTTSCGVMS